jgi:hypothetical protein
VVEAAGQPINCYIKFLEIREVFNEALGSVLCRLLGLRTPSAFVVEVRRSDYPTSSVLAAAPAPTAIAFATAALSPFLAPNQRGGNVVKLFEETPE